MEQWEGARGYFPADEPVIEYEGPGEVSALGRPLKASGGTFIITLPIQEGDEMRTGTSMDGGSRELQVPAQCQKLTDELEKLTPKVGELEMRLERVLHKKGVSVAEEQMKEAQVGLVPLADELESFHQKLARLTRAIDSMISRLEV